MLYLSVGDEDGEQEYRLRSGTHGFVIRGKSALQYRTHILGFRGAHTRMMIAKIDEDSIHAGRTGVDIALVL